jgi:hypothetical protein
MAKKKAAKKVAKKAVTKKRAANKTATSTKPPLTKKQRAERAAKAVEREIARRNKIFSAATAAEKRVLVAKDVIAQIKLKRIEAVSGAWVNPTRYAAFDPDGPNVTNDGNVANRSAQKDLLSGATGTCSCCALGAMFVSCTLFNNQTTALDLHQIQWSLGDMIEADEKLSNGLNKFFSAQQLRLIEQAFEGGHGQFTEDVDAGDEESDNPADRAAVKLSQRLLSWEDKYRNDEDRLIAIMKNIIKNNGTFKP